MTYLISQVIQQMTHQIIRQVNLTHQSDLLKIATLEVIVVLMTMALKAVGKQKKTCTNVRAFFITLPASS